MALGSIRALSRCRDQIEPHDLAVTALEIFAAHGNLLAEVGDAALDQPLGRVGQSAPRPIDHLQPAVIEPPALEQGKLGIVVELLELAVHVGVDVGQERQGRLRTGEEYGIERREVTEARAAEAAQEVGAADADISTLGTPFTHEGGER